MLKPTFWLWRHPNQEQYLLGDLLHISTRMVYTVRVRRRTSFLPKTQEVIAGRALATESGPCHLTAEVVLRNCYALVIRATIPLDLHASLLATATSCAD